MQSPRAHQCSHKMQKFADFEYFRLKNEENYQTFATNFTSPPLTLGVASSESADIYSPYVIYPEDNIVFGWQYPVTNTLYDRSPGSGETKFNSMTLFKNSKLTLFFSANFDK